MKSPELIAALLISVFMNALARAEIAETSGAMNPIQPPDDVRTGRLEDNAKIVIFTEQSGVKAASPIKVDISKPGISPKPPAPRDGKGISKPAKVVPNFSRKTIPRDTQVNSYFVHFDPAGSGSQNQSAAGSVTFDDDILGVIVTAQNLTGTHSFLGHSGTNYPQGPSQEVDFAKEGAAITLSKDMRTLTLTLVASTDSANVRVITRTGGAKQKDRGQGTANIQGGGVLQGKSAWSGNRTDVNHNVNSNCNINIIEQNGNLFTFVYCEHHCNIKVTMVFQLNGNHLSLQSWKNQSVGDWTIENLQVGMASTDGQGMEIGYSWNQSGGARRRQIQNSMASGTITVTRDR